MRYFLFFKYRKSGAGYIDNSFFTEILKKIVDQFRGAGHLHDIEFVVLSVENLKTVSPAELFEVVGSGFEFDDGHFALETPVAVQFLGRYHFRNLLDLLNHLPHFRFAVFAQGQGQPGSLSSMPLSYLIEDEALNKNSDASEIVADSQP